MLTDLPVITAANAFLSYFGTRCTALQDLVVDYQLKDAKNDFMVAMQAPMDKNPERDVLAYRLRALTSVCLVGPDRQTFCTLHWRVDCCSADNRDLIFGLQDQGNVVFYSLLGAEIEITDIINAGYVSHPVLTLEDIQQVKAKKTSPRVEQDKRLTVDLVKNGICMFHVAGCTLTRILLQLLASESGGPAPKSGNITNAEHAK